MTDTRSPRDYDVAIVGGGSAGYAAARTASAHGLRTVVLEGAEQVGGLCILRGCMPSKALLQAAEVRHMTQKGRVWGLESTTVGFDFQQVIARKDRVIGEFALHRREQLSSGAFNFIRQSAGFLDPHTVQLGNKQRLTADHFILATGSKVAPSPLPDLDAVGYLTSDDALTLSSPPRSLIVLGGGPVAVEFAQFFNRFDTAVTLIQRSPHILKEFDTDASEVIETVFTEEGIRVHTGTRLVRARTNGRMKIVEFEQEGRLLQCEAEEILYGLGRIPNTANLGLDAAGVETEEGRVIANAAQQTSAPHIYAAGDCCGPHEIVHVAVQQAEAAAHNIARPDTPRHVDERLLMEVVFTDPQVATVGVTEKQARARKLPYRAARYPFNDHGKSIIMDALHGHVKLLASPDSGAILGGTCVGPWAGELIHEIVVALHQRMNVRELAALPHYHPTLAEIWTYPAEELAETIGTH